MITHIGAVPVFADVLDDQNIDPNEIEKKSQKNKGTMPVHLTGRLCEMREIKKISKKFGIPIIEDAANQ